MANPLYDRLFGAHAGKSTPFLILPDGSTLTHADFIGRAAQIAHVLTELGLEPGDRLAAQVDKSPEALAVYAACAQAGVVFLPLNTGYTVDELTYFIDNSGARLVVCDGSKLDGLRPVAEKLGAMIETKKRKMGEMIETKKTGRDDGDQKQRKHAQGLSW